MGEVTVFFHYAGEHIASRCEHYIVVAAFKALRPLDHRTIEDNITEIAARSCLVIRTASP